MRRRRLLVPMSVSRSVRLTATPIHIRTTSLCFNVGKESYVRPYVPTSLVRVSSVLYHLSRNRFVCRSPLTTKSIDTGTPYLVLLVNNSNTGCTSRPRTDLGRYPKNASETFPETINPNLLQYSHSGSSTLVTGIFLYGVSNEGERERVGTLFFHSLVTDVRSVPGAVLDWYDHTESGRS